MSTNQITSPVLAALSMHPHPAIDREAYVHMSTGVPDGEDVCLPPKAPFFTVSGGTTALHPVYVRPINEGFRPNSPSPLRHSIINHTTHRPPLRRRLTTFLLLQDIPISELTVCEVEASRPQPRRRQALRLSTRGLAQKNHTAGRLPLPSRGASTPIVASPPSGTSDFNTRRPSRLRRFSDLLPSRKKRGPTVGLGIVAPGAWDRHALLSAACTDLALEGFDVSSLPASIHRPRRGV